MSETGGKGPLMRRALVIAGLVALAACGRSGAGDEVPQLMNLRSPAGEGANEFAILPKKPLEMPTDMAALPDPTPGGANLTDVDPKGDAVAALGGNAAVLSRPSQDGALVAHASRYGVSPQIRAELAAADVAFRRNNKGRLLERLFDVNVYFKVYAPFALDQYAETERMRRAGIPTSAVPPEGAPNR